MGVEELEAKVAELEAEVRVLHTMLRSAPDFVTRITTDGKFLYLNRLAPGFEMHHVLGTSADSYVPEQFRARAHAAMRAASETQTVQQYATVGQISADRVGHYLTRVSPVVENGQVTSLVMIATDVTELEEQRIRLQLALDGSELGIWTHNPKDGSGTWDQRTRRIFGYPERDVPSGLDEFVRTRVHPDDRDPLTEALARSADSGHFGPLTYRIVGTRGEVRWLSATGLVIRDHQGQVASIVGTVQDITERRALEERLLTAQKLESIGRLAGGVAHDFNNMLTAVFGNLHFAKESNDLQEVHALLDDVRVTAERSAALTAQLLAFARKQVLEPHVFDVNALVSRLDRVFQRAMGAHVRVVIALSAEGRVRADESQIEQVVMNLVTNARDAMPTGGALTLETLDASLGEDYASTHDVRAGDYVMIAVSDTGAGISDEDLPHIFEPFFTTRPGGTGLGLATCYGIVKQNGGHLSVYTEPGRGTTFKVYLPRALGEASLLPPKPEAPGPGAGERILLVEDEDPVRTVIERILGGNGYIVSSVRTAEDALGPREHGSHYDLLITDVVLPGADGRSLAERLLAQMPELRVLYVSGYTENGIVHGGELDAGLHFLQKPFVADDLLRMVRRVLDFPTAERVK